MSSSSPDTRRGSLSRAARRHPATVIAVIALAFSMVGTAAATQALNENGANAAKKKKGKAGPRGPAGPPGATGATGPSGFTGRVEINDSAPYNSTSPKVASAATCPPGKVIIGGGAIVTKDSATTPVALTASGPPSAGATSWYAEAYETTATGDSWNIQVSLYCANPAP